MAMMFLSSQLNRTLFSFGMIAILFIVFLDPIHIDMMMDADGMMPVSDCPFMAGGAICNMTLFEHISAWQSIFIAVPQVKSGVLVVLLALVAIAGLVWNKNTHSPPTQFFAATRRLYYQTYVLPRSFLAEAFSNGILHPKLF